MKAVKISLTTSLQRRKHPFEELRTLVAEAEAVINARPLMYVGPEEEVLTPSHLLYRKLISLVPPVATPDNNPEYGVMPNRLCVRYQQLTDDLHRFYILGELSI